MEVFSSEEELLTAFADIIRALDPDMLIGFDVQKVPCVGLLTGAQLRLNCQSYVRLVSLMGAA